MVPVSAAAVFGQNGSKFESKTVWQNGKTVKAYLGQPGFAISFLDHFKERYDKKLSKAYLEGRYGAVLVLKSFSDKVGEDE